jgi:hypothetical protein
MAFDLPLHLQVAILGADGNPVGSGLMLDDAHILTCAHVVRMATGIEDQDPPPPYDRDINIQTLPWQGNTLPTARLMPGAWERTSVVPGDKGLRDLALLKLSAPLANVRHGWGLYPGAHVPKAPVTLFAFPEGQIAGVRSDIILKGVVGDGWWQVDNTPAAQFKIAPGFSGSPVFEPSIERVLGLVAEADRGAARVGFLIPGSILLAFLADVVGQDFADRFRASAALHGAPDLPKKLVQRTAVVQGIARMLSGDNPTVGLVGLRGMGGIGKTVAARLLADDPTIRHRYHDGIFWRTVGENGKQGKEEDVRDQQQELLKDLGGQTRGSSSSIDDLRDAITKELDGRKVLLVIDDVWTSNDVRAFSIRAEGCAVLFTSRKASGFERNDVPIKNIELLEEPEAEELFRAYVGIADNVELKYIQRKILGHCNRHALGVVVAGSMVGRRPKQATLILDRFEKADVSRIVAAVPEYRRSNDYPRQETSLYILLQTTSGFLDDRDKSFLDHFAIFPEDTQIPMAAIELLGPMAKLDDLEVEQCVESLDDAALLTLHRNVEPPYVTLHDLQRDFVVCKAEERGETGESHAALIKAFRDRYGHGKLYAEEPNYPSYLRRFMILHLLKAGMATEALELLIDPDWIAHRLRVQDPVWEIIRDYDLGLADTGGPP